MRIGGVGMSPYIYNSNMVSSLSMNKISAIPDDVTQQKIDYTDLLSEELENSNPLSRGQSRDFMEILSSQLSMSRYHQAKVMKDTLPVTEEDASFAIDDMADEMQNLTKPQEVPEAAQESAGNQETTFSAVIASQELPQQDTENQNPMQWGGNGYTPFQMNQAIQAYEMSMGIA